MHQYGISEILFFIIVLRGKCCSWIKCVSFCGLQQVKYVEGNKIIGIEANRYKIHILTENPVFEMH